MSCMCYRMNMDGFQGGQGKRIFVRSSIIPKDCVGLRSGKANVVCPKTTLAFFTALTHFLTDKKHDMFLRKKRNKMIFNF